MDKKGPSGNATQNASLGMSVLQVGGMSAASGLIYGGVSGIWQATHPVVKSISSGIHWFAFGTSYWALRSFVLKENFQDKATPTEKSYVSAFAGGLSGAGVNWAVTRRFVPGLVIFSLLGYAGQRSYTTLDEWNMKEQANPSKPLGQRIAESKLMPFRVLSDDQYKEMLNEKLLGVEAEIALIDEKVQALKDAEVAKKSRNNEVY